MKQWILVWKRNSRYLLGELITSQRIGLCQISACLSHCFLSTTLLCCGGGDGRNFDIPCYASVVWNWSGTVVEYCIDRQNISCAMVALLAAPFTHNLLGVLMDPHPSFVLLYLCIWRIPIRDRCIGLVINTMRNSHVRGWAVYDDEDWICQKLYPVRQVKETSHRMIQQGM